MKSYPILERIQRALWNRTIAATPALSNSEVEAPGTLKILIASAPKTGNTWLKVILSQLFKLPIVSLDGRFSLLQAQSVGPRWVAHQHYRPTPDVLEWAKANGVYIVTMIRHPADALVSYYHYACNYPADFHEDPQLKQVIELEIARRGRPCTDQIGETELIAAIENRLIADTAISISWIASRAAITVRYEDLLLNPEEVVNRLAARLGTVSKAAVQVAVTRCELGAMRRNAGASARFFRKAQPGEWRQALPGRIIRRLRDEEPYRSQIRFLGYQMDGPNGSDAERPPSTLQQSERVTNGDLFANRVPITPFIRLLFTERKQRWSKIDETGAENFFEWLNASAEEDPTPNAVPKITNLAASIYQSRPDLQRFYPDIFGRGRVDFSDWYLRYTIEEFRLDPVFLVPVALSWMRNVPALSSSLDVLTSVNMGKELSDMTHGYRRTRGIVPGTDVLRKGGRG